MIRKMQPNEYHLLDDFLYQAIYQPDKNEISAEINYKKIPNFRFT